MKTIKAGLFICILFGVSHFTFAGLISYKGEVLNGTAPDGSSYSYGHEATRSPMTPTGGWTQYAGGRVIFALDSSSFAFNYWDFGPEGLSEGDKLYVRTTVELRDYEGSVSGDHSLTDTIGHMHFGGVLTVGGLSSPAYTHGLSGYLYYYGTLTEDASHGSHYDAGTHLAGKSFYQAAALSEEFNGIRETDTGLQFAIWGDTHGPNGNYGALFNDDGAYRHPYGFDIVVKARPVPEPATMVLSLLGIGGMVAARRRKKK